MRRRRWRWNETVWERTKAVTLWTIGAVGVVDELFIRDRPRPEALPILGVLLGLPFVQRAENKRRPRPDPDDPGPENEA